MNFSVKSYQFKDTSVKKKKEKKGCGGWGEGGGGTTNIMFKEIKNKIK